MNIKWLKLGKERVFATDHQHFSISAQNVEPNPISLRQQSIGQKMSKQSKNWLELIKKICSKLSQCLSTVRRRFLLSTRQIHCKFFKRGEGLCPFGSKCFYLHVDKHGHTVELGPPRRRQRINARGELENFSDVFMVSVFSNEDFGRFFDEYAQQLFLFDLEKKMPSLFWRYDFLFDDEDDESHHSNLTDEDELRFADEHTSDNDDENCRQPGYQ